MNTLTIKRKIAVGSLVLGGAFVAQALATSAMELTTASDMRALELTGSAMQNHMEADMMHDAVRGAVYRQLYFADHGNGAEVRGAAREVSEHITALKAAVAANQKLPLDEAVKDRLAGVATALDGYTAQAEAISTTVVTNPADAAARLADFDHAFHALETAQEDVSKALEAQQEKVALAADAQARMALWMLGLVSLVFVAMLAWSARHLRRTVVTPIDELAAHLQQMTTGDFSRVIPAPVGNDEIAAIQHAARAFRAAGLDKQEADAAQQQVVAKLAEHLEAMAGGDLSRKIETPFSAGYETLRQAFNATVDRLADLMRKVRSSAQSVANGTSEIRAASADLARRNEQQAASLEETSAAMNQVTHSVKTTADGASEVQQSVSAAHQEASEGSTVVRRAVEAMAQIEQSSSGIAQIVDVIDGIAFQTNLLALNAGVEAARAGDAGKGFAVVANEVRALAQRSAEAAKDIKQLISASTHQVSGGVTLVDEAGHAFDAIVGRVGQISTMVADIARSNESQSANLVQVNVAVGDMDRMTQQNAAMVEQSTAAARSLADEAGHLSQLVDQFRIAAGNRPREREVIAPLPPRKPAPTATVLQGSKAVGADCAPAGDWSEF